MEDKDYFDNYSKKYKGGFWGGIAWTLLFAVCYGIYKLVEWIIKK